MFKVEKVTDARGRILIQDPPVARFLFQGTTASWVWLVLRIWVGWEWFEAGLHKFQSEAWMGPEGLGILGYWKTAAAVPAPPAKPAITYDWYRGFLQFLVDANAAPWFSKVIVFGELAVGVGLILGAFVGVAAAGGLTMNLAFLLAGSTSTNPVMAVSAIVLILAWKNAGYIGLDRFLLPALGTPWGKPAVAAAAPGKGVPAKASAR